ncbi:MAG: DNA-directed RNA polymerase subunit beta' [Bacillales bacterium]|jgi:DNA-directed RNA polymerase subunit beta'|nr:DNA-directed RNA polymerase subunit beta' [Bacillales bacterium]
MIEKFNINKIESIQVKLASPEKIRSWSKGEVENAETINYRTGKPVKGGLFCQRIFGPIRDYECECGKYKRGKAHVAKCDQCQVEVTVASVRRQRMGHIALQSPVCHIWYVKGIPSRIATILGIKPKDLEDVIHFQSNIVLTADRDTNPIFEEREVFFKDTKVNEKTRNKFIQVYQNIIAELSEGTTDYNIAQDYLARISDKNEPFEFDRYAKFIQKYTDAEFGIGSEAIKELLKGLDLEKERENVLAEIDTIANEKDARKIKLYRRLQLIETFRKVDANGKLVNRPEWMVLDVVPVIPANLRPMLPLDGGRFAASDLNDLYRRVITRNNRLKELKEQRAPQLILVNEKRILQDAVDALFNNGKQGRAVTNLSGRALKSLSDNLKGKQGRFRQNLLGKRVDYSGRSVIAVGPTLKMYQCGLPREMALELFKPFIIHEICKENETKDRQSHISLTAANELISRREARVLEILDQVIKERPVLLNRAPTLHRLGIQAFEPILVEGMAIRLHPLVCSAFNADFDGDQMAVHIPLSNAACAEARTLMLGSNAILKPSDGNPIVTPSQDMVLGNYYLTLENTSEKFKEIADTNRKDGNIHGAEENELYALSEGKIFKSVEDLLLAVENRKVHLHNRVLIKVTALERRYATVEQKEKFLATSVGKVIFNLAFDKGFPYLDEEKEIYFLNDTKDLNRPTPNEYYVSYQDLNKHYAETGSKNWFSDKEPVAPFAKKDLSKIIKVIFRDFKSTGTSVILDAIKDQGFLYATQGGFTVSLADIPVLKDKASLIKNIEEKVEKYEEAYLDGQILASDKTAKVVAEWRKIGDDIEKELLPNQMKKEPRNPLYMMSTSGARGSTSNFFQLSGMRGVMAKPNGESIEIPIKSSFRDGLTVSEFFISTHGARKGGADTALKTAESGYLTRRLVDVSQDVIVRENDCWTDHNILAEGTLVSAFVTADASGKEKVVESLANRLKGRYTISEIVSPTGVVLVPGDHLISDEEANEIEASGLKEVLIRSLLSCKAHNGVCRKCYGRSLATAEEIQLGEAVGVIAAQSIGEPGTQLTMRTFHTGGVATDLDITQGLPRVNELFDVRTPKGEAVIADFDGRVERIDINQNARVVWLKRDINPIEIKKTKKESKDDRDPMDYQIPYDRRIIVKEGDVLKAGDSLTDGVKNLKILLAATNAAITSDYILKEVQKVYAAQNIEISDKHIEVIIRQMLSKCVIVKPGASDFIIKERADIQDVEEHNAKILLEADGDDSATIKFQQVILGITKASLATNSFLSAASFQETTRVLTDATVRGKSDFLHGLKENVIVGKLIPAGTGYAGYVNIDYHRNDYEVEVEQEVEEDYSNY